MPQLLFTLRVQRENGKPLKNPRECRGVYFETHNQSTFAWSSPETPAARPLHNATIALHPNGVSVIGFEREGDTYVYQEWWMLPEALEAAETTPDEPIAESSPRRPRFQWDDGLVLGTEAVDEGHRVLVDQAARLDDLATNGDLDGFRMLVGEMIDDGIYNFAREEGLLDYGNYPGLEAHRLRHESLLNQMRRHQDEEGDPRDLLDLLADWIDRHIRTEDPDWVPYLTAETDASAPIRAVEAETEDGSDWFEDDSLDPEPTSVIAEPVSEDAMPLVEDLPESEEEDLDLGSMLFDCGDEGIEDREPVAPDSEDNEPGLGHHLMGTDDDDQGLVDDELLIDDVPEADGLSDGDSEDLLLDDEPESDTPSAEEAVLATDSGRIQWTDDMSVGLEPVDNDHRVMLDLINELHEVKESDSPLEREEVMGSVLNALVEYTDYHFEREQRIMEAVEYSETATHLKTHDDMKEIVHSLKDQFDIQPETVDLELMYEFLRTWLIQHILKDDMAYAPLVRDNEAAEVAAQSLLFSDDELDDDSENLFESLSDASAAAASVAAKAEMVAREEAAPTAQPDEPMSDEPMSDEILMDDLDEDPQDDLLIDEPETGDVEPEPIDVIEPEIMAPEPDVGADDVLDLDASMMVDVDDAVLLDDDDLPEEDDSDSIDINELDDILNQTNKDDGQAVVAGFEAIGAAAEDEGLLDPEVEISASPGSGEDDVGEPLEPIEMDGLAELADMESLMASIQDLVRRTEAADDPEKE
ncbi:bacteriohemerythrin [Magnetospira sp. QH-2]|uniref:bacteriohemerythrin n=1 Tax=Magnetospira sp. (strain QH-2) TaxID=1288970 RepID=UPI0003E81AC9|nr:bacteriohemerythrin [Magnetospira sp. QH-2]CCQ73894.1 Protein of unknown function [Magnetospira sp. QH-2]